MKLLKLAAIASMILVAGCSSDGGGGARDDSSVKEPGAVDDFSRRFVSVLLPSKVELEFPYVITSERLYAREDGGETRRGLMLEFLGGDEKGVADLIVRGFEKGGYKPRKAPMADEEGRLAFTLIRRGNVPVYVDVRPAGNRKLQSPDARGTVWISWRIRDDAGSSSKN